MLEIRPRRWLRSMRHNRANNALLKDFSPQQVRKVHIGCGTHVIHNWLNCDVWPSSANVFKLDATQPFPFPDGWADYVYSEHMIEHLDYKDGSHMLRETHRILKPGGMLRVSTPDLGFLLRMGTQPLSDLDNRYISWAMETFLPDIPDGGFTFMFNNFVRDWGHKFIYDEQSFRKLLSAVGFRDITKCNLCESSHPDLRNLENENRMPEGFLRLETMTFECSKA